MPVPRILPLMGVAVAGVLTVNAMAGARQLPDLLTGAKALAEGVAMSDTPAKGKGAEAATTGAATDAAAAVSGPAPAKPQPVCAPTAAELAKEAGLSPAELQVLQSLGERRGQLDQRENDLNTQLALMAAAEAKLDAKVKALDGLKADVQALLAQAEQKDNAEVDRLVKVFEGMKPKDAGPRMMVLDDTVRLPIAAKMKDRSLAAVLSQMPPSEAKKLAEGLAARFRTAKALAATAQAAATSTSAPAPVAASGPAVTASAGGATGAAPVKKAPAKRAAARKAAAPARKAAPAAAQAAAQPSPAKPAPAAAAPAAAPQAAKAG